jgi:uncharacterized protein YndB with AHSA1/START domain
MRLVGLIAAGGGVLDDPGNPGMQALMVVRAGSGEELVRVGELWLRLATREISPAAWAQVPERPPGKRGGAPGGMSARVTVITGPMTVKGRGYSKSAWEWGLRSLAEGAPGVEVTLSELNENGEAYQGPETANLTVSARRRPAGAEDGTEDGTVLLEAGGDVPGPEGEVWRPEVPQRWAGVMRTVAEASDVEYGYLSDVGGWNGRTPLEWCLKLARTTRPPGPLLRGYSWLTICPPEAASVLGGAAGLAGTGAFHEVAELPSGAVWLQATQRFDEYEEVAATRVFRVVAPVLPGGLPDPGPAEEQRFRLAWRDADWYRPGRRPGQVPPLDWAGTLAEEAGPGAGRVREVPGGYEASFRRVLGHDAERTWQALTDPPRIGRWLGWRPKGEWLPQHPWGLPGPGRVDLEAGGVVVLPYCHVDEYGPRIVCNLTTGTVTAVAPRQLLEYVIPGADGPDATVRWQLEDADGGTSLSLRYRFQVRDRVPLVLADWHCRLAAIEALLDGRDPASVWQDYASRAAAYAF